MNELRRHVDDGVLSLTIDRPANENRIDRSIALAIADALRSARDDAAVRVVVLSASGTVFCLGGQIDRYPEGTSVDYLRFSRAFADLLAAIANLGKPLIAAVQGDALAGGFSLVAECDMAIAADGARFGLPELEYGLFPLMALSNTVDLIPKKLLFEIIYQSRILTAHEALQFHLINRVVRADQLMPETMTVAKSIATRSATSVTIGRDAVYGMRNMSPVARAEHARFALASMLSTDDAKEAALAKRSGRTPRFTGQ